MTDEALVARWCDDIYRSYTQTQAELLRFFALIAAAESTGMVVIKAVHPVHKYPVQAKFMCDGGHDPRTISLGNPSDGWHYDQIEYEVEEWIRREKRSTYLHCLRQKLEGSLTHDEKVALGLVKDKD